MLVIIMCINKDLILCALQKYQTPYQQNSVPAPDANITIVRTAQQMDVGPEPDSYLCCSVISLCFCLIFGIVAIVHSSKVRLK